MTTMDFSNTEIAFSGRSLKELKRSRFVFGFLFRSPFMQIGMLLLKVALFLRLPVSWAVKPLVFAQFCGGERLDECGGVIESLFRAGVYSVPDYSVEGLETEKGMEDSYREILKLIDFASGNPAVPFAVFKPSSLIRREVAVKSGAGMSLTDDESSHFQRFRDRLFQLGARCAERGVMLLIDAEEYEIQNTFDRVAGEMMQRFNGERTVVFNTVQMYRSDRYAYVESLIAHAKENHYIAAVKLVRGAYMEKERMRALQMGYPSPIHPDKTATDSAYNRACSLIIRNHSVCSLFAGTHNEESVSRVMDEMKEVNLTTSSKKVWLSQLYGMSDHLTYNLADGGYNVAKYLPYGPVRSVMPYLMRRAAENSSVKGQTGRELELIKKEINRRKSS